jgi:hypothetical protein
MWQRSEEDGARHSDTVAVWKGVLGGGRSEDQRCFSTPHELEFKTFLLIHSLVLYCVTVVTGEHVVIKMFENCTEQCFERAHKKEKMRGSRNAFISPR